MAKSSGFKFRTYDTIGDPSAESDERFLSRCFVDTGALAILSETTDPRAIALGRTGTGKTALVRRLADGRERVRELDPHDIALGYISNSSVLRFFEGAGVSLDPFYRFLWRHLLVVETLKMRFDLQHEGQKPGWWDATLMGLLRKPAHKEAFEYLRTCGTSFVANTERQIKEVTVRVERDLKTHAQVDFGDVLKLGAEGARKLTEEQRHEVHQRDQDVLNRIQVNQLTMLFKALDEDLLTDLQKRYYVVLDRLDENWVDDETRYRLLRALIEVMRDYNSKVRMGKVIISLRTDLFDRVLRETTDSRFQGEKYRSLCLPLTWDESSLTTLLDLRIEELVRARWTGQPVTHGDVLVGTVGKKKERPLNYMLDHSLMRPRDVITFFNTCVAHANNEPVISPQLLTHVEAVYSEQRLDSLADEWATEYPLLKELCVLLKKRPISFPLGEITDSQLDDLCLRLAERPVQTASDDGRALTALYNEQMSRNEVRIAIARILYRVGAVGLKPESYGQIMWSYRGGFEVPTNQIDDSTKVYPHKMLWRALGTQARMQ